MLYSLLLLIDKEIDMKFKCYSHRYADAIIQSDENLKQRYNEFIGVIRGITDQDLREDFLRKKEVHNVRGTSFKSITPSINSLMKERIDRIPGWESEVDIFNDEVIGNTEWRLDFACADSFCVEVAFNHGEAIAWNLLKPVLSCELNHVKKAVQGKIGIYVCATDKLKKTGNIDSASGSFEKVLRYIKPMMNQLTIPMMIIGLDELETFKINKKAEIIDSFKIDSFVFSDWEGVNVEVTTYNGYHFRGIIVEYYDSKIDLQEKSGLITTINLNEIRFVEKI